MSEVRKYRKKPIVVEAVQFNGSNQKDSPVRKFCPTAVWELCPLDIMPTLRIPTLEGEMIARVGDWIIKGVRGEFYPCKPDIFAATYEAVDPA